MWYKKRYAVRILPNVWQKNYILYLYQAREIFSIRLPHFYLPSFFQLAAFSSVLQRMDIFCIDPAVLRVRALALLEAFK